MKMWHDVAGLEIARNVAAESQKTIKGKVKRQ